MIDIYKLFSMFNTLTLLWLWDRILHALEHMSDLATSAKLHLWYVQDLGDLCDLCKVAFVVCTGRHMQPKEGIRQQWSLGLLGVAFDRKTKAAFVQVFENQNTFHNVLIAIPGCETTPVCEKLEDRILYAMQGRHRQTTVVGLLPTSEKLHLYPCHPW